VYIQVIRISDTKRCIQKDALGVSPTNGYQIIITNNDATSQIYVCQSTYDTVLSNFFVSILTSFLHLLI